MEYQDFASNYFCLTVTKNSVGEAFSLSLSSGIEKVRMRGRGGLSVKIFRRRFLVSVLENFVRKNFGVSLLSTLDKIYASEGYVTIFCRKFFVSHGRKYS